MLIRGRREAVERSAARLRAMVYGGSLDGQGVRKRAVSFFLASIFLKRLVLVVRVFLCLYNELVVAIVG